MSVVWHRTLVPIDFCNKVIQANDATLDMKVANIESLLAQLVAFRDSWKAIWNEVKLVTSSVQIEIKLFRDRNSTAKKRTRFQYKGTPNKNVDEMNEADEMNPLRKPTSESTYFMLYWIMLLKSLQFVSVQKTDF